MLVLLQHQLSCFSLLFCWPPHPPHPPPQSVHQTNCCCNVHTHDIWFFPPLKPTMFNLNVSACFCSAQSPLRLGTDLISCWICRCAEKAQLLNAKECRSSFVSLNGSTASRITARSQLKFSVSTKTRRVDFSGPLVQFLAWSCVWRLKGATQGEEGSVCYFFQQTEIWGQAAKIR